MSAIPSSFTVVINYDSNTSLNQNEPNILNSINAAINRQQFSNSINHHKKIDFEIKIIGFDQDWNQIKGKIIGLFKQFSVDNIQNGTGSLDAEDEDLPEEFQHVPYIKFKVKEIKSNDLPQS